VKVLLLVSAFNGLSQRAWCALRDAGHQVGVLLATGQEDIIDGVRRADPDLIICPFLKDRVPAEVWNAYRTIIIHPGPVGDRGPSSLDWAITEAAPRWGVTALQAVQEMDAGPIWAHRVFPMPVAPVRKSALYNGPVADAAMECVHEVLAKATDPAFVPTPLAAMDRDLPEARLRPMMRQSDRAFDFGDDTGTIVRRIRAADGAPGVLTRVAGLDVHAYDAHPGAARGAEPGSVICRRDGAVLVGTGDGSVWLGHLRAPRKGVPGIKLAATAVLGARMRTVPHSRLPVTAAPDLTTYRPLRYRREADVGWLTFAFYNGAMSTGHCRRLLAALRYAASQDTRVLVLRGSTEAFSNGIHLNTAATAGDPALAAWHNIRAINAVCREIITCTRQVVVAAYTGSAGAGGVMLGLGADVTVGREGVVLNPYYDIGLYGSELHTYTLPRRVGADTAQRLLDQRLPVDAGQAARFGLLDEIGPRDPGVFKAWLTDLTKRFTAPGVARSVRTAKERRLRGERLPLNAYETRELAEMSRDMFDDRSGFTAARTAFVHKSRPTRTPERLAFTPPADDPATFWWGPAPR
jgi:putative two-component system hydrogenase maturation factor HypX/HoxX